MCMDLPRNKFFQRKGRLDAPMVELRSLTNCCHSNVSRKLIWFLARMSNLCPTSVCLICLCVWFTYLHNVVCTWFSASRIGLKTLSDALYILRASHSDEIREQSFEKIATGTFYILPQPACAARKEQL